MPAATSMLKIVTLGNALFVRVATRSRKSDVRALRRDDPGSVGERQAVRERYRFFVANLDRMISAFRKGNPQIKIVLSTLVGRWPHDDMEQFKSRNGHIWWTQGQADDFRIESARLLGLFNDVIRAYARTNELLLVDNARAFEDLDRGRLQWDFAHLTEHGYRIMAMNFYEALRDAGWVRGAKMVELATLRDSYLRGR
jgi:lysophospholipase L1-like esterase